jgi:hypothetical protein
MADVIAQFAPPLPRAVESKAKRHSQLGKGLDETHTRVER